MEEDLLVRLRRQQAVDADVLRLADAVHTSLRLEVILGIPVAVEDDDGVRRGQVDAEAARARGEKHQEGGRVRRAEAVDRRLALGAAHPTVEALVREVAVRGVVGEQVERADLRGGEDGRDVYGRVGRGGWGDRAQRREGHTTGSACPHESRCIRQHHYTPSARK